MADRDKRSFHIIFNLVLLILITTLETSIWHTILALIPNPQLWLSVVVFVFLYRSPIESMVIIYVPSFFIYLLTMQPLGYLLLAQTLVFLLVNAVKTRMFVPGQFYFSVMYAASVLTFQLLIYIFSWVFEAKPLFLSQAFSWIVQSVIAFVVSPLVYKIIQRANPKDEFVGNSGDGFL